MAVVYCGCRLYSIVVWYNNAEFGTTKRTKHIGPVRLWRPEAAGQFNTATAEYMERQLLRPEWSPAVWVCRDTHTHKITNETVNVNGLTRVINLSVAAGQQGSASQQSCQNSAAVWTEIATVVEETSRQACGLKSGIGLWNAPLLFQNERCWTGLFQTLYIHFGRGGGAGHYHKLQNSSNPFL